MKRIMCLILTVVILLSGCAVHNEEKENIPETDTTPVSAVWIYYDELSMIKEKGGTEKSFRKKMQMSWTSIPCCTAAWRFLL
jgi:hypothetical protein